MVDTIKRPSVAVIGSGLAGLTAAYLLSSFPTQPECGFDVHLFEKAASLGMDSHSISITTEDNKEQRIDVPMRSFQGGYYKQVIALYRKLGVEFRTANFSYSLSSLKQWLNNVVDLQTYLLYNGSSGTKGVSSPSTDSMKQDFVGRFLGCLSFVIGTLVLLYNYLRLVILSSPLSRPGPSVTFRDWTVQTSPRNFVAKWLNLDKAWIAFAQDVLTPIFSAVCTAPEEDIYDHPMEEFLEYIWKTLGTDHYVVKRGVREVVSHISRDIKHVHVSTTITSIELDKEDTSKLTIKTTEGTYHGFSHIILATQANSGVPLLKTYHSSLPDDAPGHKAAVQKLIDCLDIFHYRKSIVINHTDSRFVPQDKRDRRDLNLVLGTADHLSEKDIDSVTLPSSYTMATHLIANLKSEKPVYQTTNPIVPPSKDSLLSVSVLERAVVTTASKVALEDLSRSNDSAWGFGSSQSSLGPLQGAGRLESAKHPGIWICGSYAYKGIPLLEGCVASARDVVEQGIMRCEGVALREEPW
ncbi:hypothetical protein M422DRAFT_251293 [Sphaerobolus stellatus SS14]|uniref:FAD/NAD(P)-binding domain-containing protein n=1 Tax=Sphaerobolus stellatus (strain SS14) TaxID=990650 RepID=A0A0C9VRQ3_SPHS4|nr:hypothetical protein M422DRAFT_251293 [Sphaerobolus stellatus SS14]